MLLCWLIQGGQNTPKNQDYDVKLTWQSCVTPAIGSARHVRPHQSKVPQTRVHADIRIVHTELIPPVVCPFKPRAWDAEETTIKRPNIASQNLNLYSANTCFIHASAALSSRLIHVQTDSFESLGVVPDKSPGILTWCVNITLQRR